MMCVCGVGGSCEGWCVGGGGGGKLLFLGNFEIRARGEGEGRARVKGEEVCGLMKWVVFYDDVGFWM